MCGKEVEDARALDRVSVDKSMSTRNGSTEKAKPMTRAESKVNGWRFKAEYMLKGRSVSAVFSNCS